MKVSDINAVGLSILVMFAGFTLRADASSTITLLAPSSASADGLPGGLRKALAAAIWVQITRMMDAHTTVTMDLVDALWLSFIILFSCLVKSDNTLT